MKLLFLTLLITLKLIDLTGGSCRLRASVWTVVHRRENGDISGVLCQTQLQLMCDSVSCPETNFTTCDTYSELGISGGSRVLNLCEDTCIINNHECTASMPETLTPVINTSPTSVCASTTTVYTNTTVTKWLTATVTFNTFPTTNYGSTVIVQIHRQPDTKFPTENKTCSSTASSVLGALMGIFMVLLVTVTIGWMWTCWITNNLKKRGRAQNIRDTNINNDATDLNLDNNPAYDTQTTLHKNVAYEDSTLHTGKEQQSSAQLSTTEPTYEIIPPAIYQTASAATVMTTKESGDEYDKLNRVLPEKQLKHF